MRNLFVPLSIVLWCSQVLVEACNVVCISSKCSTGFVKSPLDTTEININM